MKKIISILLVILLIASLGGCGKNAETSQEKSTKATSTEKSPTINYPKSNTTTFETSENKLGMRYTFTLQEYNDMLNTECKKLGNSDMQFFDYENWQIMSENLTDDNGVKYASYCYATDMLTITVAVEKESGKVMNISCGAPYEQFQNSSEEFQYNVILTAAILSMVAGGYDSDSLEFLYSIFYDSAKNKSKFYYDGHLYMMDYSKGAGDASVVLFMTSPCDQSIIDDWKLIDYATFDGSYTS